jgi:AraC family transcriptional regulator, regulatory protein of adaptative response / methylated-DNA-[protein]-cysteine methyltransferase
MHTSPLKIFYDTSVSPFGLFFIAHTQHEICRLVFCEKEELQEIVAELGLDWSEADIVHGGVHTRMLAQSIFSSSRLKKPLTLLVKGTDFQLKVWKALLSIPEGEVTSYAKVARMIGHPKSVRAVGTACGANKIAYLVPCHRVLLSQGGIGGYTWGIERKKEMLRREKIEKVS